jgi:peptidoglycan/xylan/chitin deacetylase (PgdA/CDA1 family)
MVVAMSLARGTVKVAGRLVDMVAPPEPGLTVLLYHRVGALSSLEVDLSADLFRSQIALLAESGRATTLGDALGMLTSETLPAAPPVVVTFDDGTADVVDVALPILAEFGVPATLYLATRFIDEQSDFPDDGRPASWSGLADAVSSGWLSVGSHTHDHLLLDRVSLADATWQIERSVDLIGERLQVRADDFAYPKAIAASGPVQALVASRFRSAAVAGGGVNRAGANLHHLARVPIQRSDGMRWFARKMDGGLALEGRLRDAASRFRYAGARS